ncbi:MAG: YhdH/YhfP family quinone oxidoreductase [Liquorilactobacillus hordei]|uniref:YhdH/YhfP family quinone oxidoreductase n=1 Tax=Lactobacillaceae TaxID=33958 RepID=UPI001CC1C83D|nr:YhdH/YhfP family quinone oxidoreductase [Lentilactobacillus hilgardii]MBZ2202690.1 NADPH:quinone reductase [Lentilactobacillus hilgardii]MBZ2205633.1 NADPH:quinone reductase [Lentilactobacillus hilgardii]
MDTFKALIVRENEGKISYQVEEQTKKDMLDEGEVLIKIAYSSVNYKDMLAVQKNGGVIRRYPMIPGIDLSGTIEESTDPKYTIGQQVLVTGYDMGMTHTGGFSEYARVPSSWIVRLPENLSMKEAMIFGTAGLTSALSVFELEKNGMNPSLDQAILVTGATGGVGSIALQILSKAGYNNITAMVRKENQIDVAKTLGANKVVLLSDFEFIKKPLAKQTFHYILDTVGGELVSNLLPYVYYQGGVSLCGNAGGIKLNTTVLPFILRGINLIGIDSVNISQEYRQMIWSKLAKEWKITGSTLTTDISLDELPDTIQLLKEGKHLGRTVVDITR